MFPPLQPLCLPISIWSVAETPNFNLESGLIVKSSPPFVVKIDSSPTNLRVPPIVTSPLALILPSKKELLARMFPLEVMSESAVI